MAYRVDPPDCARAVALDSLTAIYHRASGQTHVVVEPLPEILAVLGAQGVEIAELAQLLNLPVDNETNALLTERLDELIAIGLVQRA